MRSCLAWLVEPSIVTENVFHGNADIGPAPGGGYPPERLLATKAVNIMIRRWQACLQDGR
jgi:hypothetical protein